MQYGKSFYDSYLLDFPAHFLFAAILISSLLLTLLCYLFVAATSATYSSLLLPLHCYLLFSATFSSLLLNLLCYLLFSATSSSLLLPLLCYFLFSATYSSLLLSLLCYLIFSATYSSLLLTLLCYLLFSASFSSLRFTVHFSATVHTLLWHLLFPCHLLFADEHLLQYFLGHQSVPYNSLRLSQK